MARGARLVRLDAERGPARDRPARAAACCGTRRVAEWQTPARGGEEEAEGYLVTRVALGAAALLFLLSAPITHAAVTPGGPAGVSSALPESKLTAAQRAFVDTLERRTFQFFWDLADSGTGLMPDRWPSRTFISIGATGFALTAYPIGAERHYVTRAEAAARTLRALDFLWNSRQDTARVGSTGYKGFFYHFMNFGTGSRFRDIELSNIDTALLFAGALFCQSYFDGGGQTERRIRALTDSLVLRADWAWFKVRPPKLSLGWSPEQGFLPYDWGGYNETMLLFLLALDSPRHGVGMDTYRSFTAGYKWGQFQGQEYLGFAPLFGHQYTACWVDYRNIADDYMRAKRIDYFENSRRATLAQRAYAIANPSGFRDYGADIWGLTACDGPMDGKATLGGRERMFHSYEARGASHERITDDGTIAPAAAGGSMPFAPEICLPALMAMRERRAAGVLEVVDALLAHEVVGDVPVVDPDGRVLVAEERREAEVLLTLEASPLVARREALVRVHRHAVPRRVEREQEQDHRLVVAAPVVREEALFG